uniref:Phosphatidylinositol 4-phosphate 5-kinase 5-like n=1 Tax=Diabrotica virgifera virgifera TaxID=50390 RepID=A0A6P7FV18_DIAVI
MADEELEEEENVGEGGEGKEIYPYGEYEGGRDDQLDRHGFGSALLPNGDIYEGEYYHGKRHGRGMYCFKNGSRYSGMWKKGLKHGKGEFLYPDGTKYVGDWRKDFKHGYGTYYYVNGDTYEGCWYQGLRHGLGTYTFKSSNVTHYGTWKEGRMEGPGIINYPQYRFHGSFEKNLPKGPGCFTFDAKYMQHGFYVNVRDPKFDYVGSEELQLSTNEEDREYRDSDVFQENATHTHTTCDNQLDRCASSLQSDVRKAMQQAKNNKAAGPDQMPAGLLKLLDECAYDSVDRNALYKAMIQFNIPIHLLKLVKATLSTVEDYKTELLPPEPTPVPVKEEEDSLIDIIDYLQKYEEVGYKGEEEEEHRALPSPVTQNVIENSPDPELLNV